MARFSDSDERQHEWYQKGEITMNTYTFSENNSGGHWWLALKDYENLMKAGWYYIPGPYAREEGWDKRGFTKDDPVPYGWRKDLKYDAGSVKEAVECWESVTGQDFFDQGCGCCGAPFSMSGSEGSYVSGNSVVRETVRPW